MKKIATTSTVIHFTALNCIMNVINVNRLKTVSSGAPEFTKVH